MPVLSLTSLKPHEPTSPSPFSLLTSTPLLPHNGTHHMDVHTVVVVVVFCAVCFLLLLAFFYAFCFRCSIGWSRKESCTANSCSLEPEEATYKCSSSDSHSVQNTV